MYEISDSGALRVVLSDVSNLRNMVQDRLKEDGTRDVSVSTDTLFGVRATIIVRVTQTAGTTAKRRLLAENLVKMSDQSRETMRDFLAGELEVAPNALNIFLGSEEGRVLDRVAFGAAAVEDLDDRV